jgi:hypothetical protein
MPSVHWPYPFALLLICASAIGASTSLVLDKKVGHLHFYKGTAELEGVAERRTGTETLKTEGDNLCFAVTGSSRRHIPREGDDRLPWFCFSDQESALQALSLLLAPASGTCGYRILATVVVGSYVVNRLESEVSDTAVLLAVKRRGTPSAVPCK